MASLRETRAGLADSFQQLRGHWGSTGAAWNDQARRTFEQEFWGVFEARTLATLREMERLGDLIATARRSVK